MADRFATASGGLDFCHVSQHFWAVAHTLHPENTPAAKAWVEPLLHQLGHGGETKVFKSCTILPA